MGKLNLLKAKYDGKVGETVGAKWKNKSTIRTYSIPANPKTEAQVTVRTAFSELTKFIALFADQIKYLTALDVSGMSVRNAIIKLNKSMIDSGTVTVANLAVSKGGLQKPQSVAFSKDSSSGAITATWSAVTATNFTSAAQAVVIAVDSENQITDVFTGLVSANTATGTVSFTNSTTVQCYVYFFDKRGTSKVASPSVAGNPA